MLHFISSAFRRQKSHQDTVNQEQLIFQDLSNAEIEFVSAALITGIRDRDNPYFWRHHGNSKEFYIELAQKSEIIYKKWCAGESIAEIQKDKDIGELSEIYLSDKFCIKLYRQPDDKYILVDDGRHRVIAAQELNIVVPAKIIGQYKRASNKKGYDNG